ncbi:MAG: hypothetical protein RL660_1394 [Bacteroidota bacterium]|jgi:hypothetical protein
MQLARKHKYGLLTIFLIGLFYIGLRLLFGLFTPYNFFTAERDIAKNKVQIIVVGFPYYPQVHNRLAKNYGFNYTYVGCNATIELLNGRKFYNKRVRSYLTRKHGSNFWETFKSQVDSSIVSQIKTDSTLNKVSNVVGSYKIVKDQIKLIDSLSHGKRRISLIPRLDDTLKNIYVVNVSEDNGTNSVTYFTFLVDGTTMKIINPNGKLTEQE